MPESTLVDPRLGFLLPLPTTHHSNGDSCLPKHHFSENHYHHHHPTRLQGCIHHRVFMRHATRFEKGNPQTGSKGPSGCQKNRPRVVKKIAPGLSKRFGVSFCVHPGLVFVTTRREILTRTGVTSGQWHIKHSKKISKTHGGIQLLWRRVWAKSILLAGHDFPTLS